MTDTRTSNIYRYKFDAVFVEQLYVFSKIHQYDERKDFKVAWNEWVDENEEKIGEEVRRLTGLGYSGNILDKMFKSARYYFRKKSTVKRAPKERREYVGINKELLDAIDKHVNVDVKPSIGFAEFCKLETDLICKEVGKLFQLGIIDSVEIHDKIKKTYKNRYFMLIRN